ncbi:hypothetical protein EJ06DRAFT_528059 [Trichodelitschia bisporula]|uniref:Xylanolytic transcriptional activator regulatory domain-containing protein n=1 Tax=Trichodelitschia bisporula TaxID=703511 RepID=A0A6G1I4V8_9PEZI|nr:hypothetical protein EJ06DRAFT_528059 [Trichodelitschia bisporula]
MGHSGAGYQVCTCRVSAVRSDPRRFSNDAPLHFKTPIEASNAFAAHARSILIPAVEQPTVGHIQGLLMLTGHSWGAGEGRSAWIYLGMALRMAQMMRLFEEPPTARNREEFVAAEERRRTAWTCFLMDSLLSGGRGRKRTLTADDIRLQLPCDTDYFHFGERVRSERLDGSVLPDEAAGPVHPCGIIASSMRAADIWGVVARWACAPASEMQLPWEPASEYQVILQSLARWEASLGPRLRYSIFLLHAHSAANQGQAYCYMHSIYFMSLMFLHRSHLPQVHEAAGGTARMRPGGPAFDEQWREWQRQSRRELLVVADQVCDMLEEMRSFGLFFLRGLVPWIGFTIYTAVGIMLYYCHFPDPDDDSDVMKRAQRRVMNGMAFLKDMRGSWPMADTWRETIKRMQVFYATIKTKGEQSVSHHERREMHSALVDYGALQPSPVQDAANSADSPGSSIEDVGPSAVDGVGTVGGVGTVAAGQMVGPSGIVVVDPTEIGPKPLEGSVARALRDETSPLTAPDFRTPPAISSTTSPSSFSTGSPAAQTMGVSPAGSMPEGLQQQYALQQQQQQQQQQMLEMDEQVSGQESPPMEIDGSSFDLLPDFEMFDVNLTIDADIEAVMADAAQGFWADFPGEVGMY